MATTIDRIDLGCARNLMRVRIRLTAPSWECHLPSLQSYHRAKLSLTEGKFHERSISQYLNQNRR